MKSMELLVMHPKYQREALSSFPDECGHPTMALWTHGKQKSKLRGE